VERAEKVERCLMRVSAAWLHPETAIRVPHFLASIRSLMRISHRMRMLVTARPGPPRATACQSPYQRPRLSVTRTTTATGLQPVGWPHCQLTIQRHHRNSCFCSRG